MINWGLFLATISEVRFLGVPKVSADVVGLLAKLKGHDFMHGHISITRSFIYRYNRCLEDDGKRLKYSIWAGYFEVFEITLYCIVAW